MTRFATPAQYSAILALRKFGLEADRDVKLLQTGGIPNSLAAMQKGVVQAAVLTAPTTIQARALGYARCPISRLWAYRLSTSE